MLKKKIRLYVCISWKTKILYICQYNSQTDQFLRSDRLLPENETKPLDICNTYFNEVMSWENEKEKIHSFKMIYKMIYKDKNNYYKKTYRKVI